MHLFRFDLNKRKVYIYNNEQCSLMQTQKTNIKLSIINAARQEFFNKGFKAASMRTISQKSNVSLSNIYNYFENKDQILIEVLNPLLRRIDEMFEEHKQTKNITMRVFSSKEYQVKNINQMIDLVENYRAELKLLLLQSHGSSLDNYADEFNMRHAEASLEYLSLMKTKFPKVNENISDFFLHITGSWFLSTLSEVVTHEELTNEEIEHFFSELITFTTFGWKALMTKK